MPVRLPSGGVPGQAQQYIVVQQGGRPQGSTGKYEVTVFLGRGPSHPSEYEKISVDPTLPGDSLLILPGGPDADSGGSKFVSLEVYAVTPDGKRYVFQGVPNEEGRVGKLVCQPFDAESFFDAAKRAKDAANGFLSSWSCQLDVPIWVDRTLVTERSTGAVQVDARAPYPFTPLFVKPIGQYGQEFAAYAGLYREAITCQSDTYQLLCLYKIMEALRMRRARLAERARASGVPVATKPDEKLPSEPKDFRPWLAVIIGASAPVDEMALNSYFPVDLQGRSFGRLKEDVEPLRNRLAHAITDTTELPKSDDDVTHSQEVQKWLPVLKCVVRMMLRNDFPTEFGVGVAG
jgi:hypothetical protein